MLFSDLNLSKPILRALEAEGYHTPTPIQAQAIPHVLEGKDVLGCAQTGTGKTAAFALPIIQRLAGTAPDKAHRGPRKARALILSPTRELAQQISDSFSTYGRGTHLDVAVIYGGVSQHRQEKALRAGVDIIVATPGRLTDLMEQGIADLSAVEIFVLDEADRMLDMGFIQPIRRIAAAVRPGARRQTLLFSATMPKAIVQLAHSLLHEPVKVSVDRVGSAAPKIEQGVYMVDRKSKQALLHHLLADPALKVERALVFTRTKHGATRVGKRLARAGIGSDTIHGDRSQSQRQRALDRFASGAARVLVATDVAARGLDVDDITHVINFDLPVEPEAYVHRIGRTGRAGATGIAVSFCDHEERSLLREVEKLLGQKITVLKAQGVAALAEVEGHSDRSEERVHHRSGHRPEGRSAPRRSRPGRSPSAPASRGSSGHSEGSRGHASGNGRTPGHSSGHASGHTKSHSRGWNKPTKHRGSR
ncbi:MAG: DEAD/DEAH box helicase [Phycisphaeraceae bacterium]|nr:DEAD/DEAH box helicase [Phycisphaeraceae bacterium]